MKRMTILFEDEELYAAVKGEAARRNRPLKEIVTEAIREWLEVQEDRELLPLAEEALAEYRKEGGLPWEEVRKELAQDVRQGERRKKASASHPRRRTGT